MDFFEKYRPVRLVDIAGQSEQVAWLRDQIRSRRDGSVLISGPTGSGKTSAGLCYARAILCEQPQDGDCCGQCEPCKNFTGGLSRVPTINLHQLECGENGAIADIREILKFSRVAPLGGRRRIFVFDEAHGLSRRAMTALLRVLEQPPRWARFIILTDQPEQLLRPLRSRVRHLPFAELAENEAGALLRRVCAAENLRYEDRAIAELYHRSGGSARDLLRAVERLMPFGAVTTETIAIAFAGGADERLSSVAAALMKADLGAAANILRTWGCSTGDKARAIHEFLVSLYLRAHNIDNDPTAVVDTVMEAAMASKVAAAAATFGCSLDECWEGLLELVTPSRITTDAELLMALKRVMNFMNPVVSSQQNPPLVSARTRKKSFRVTSVVPGSRMEYLTWNDIRPFWEAATFLPQHYGMLFNVRVSVRGPDEWAHKDQALLVTALTQKLGMQIQYWNGGERSFHWLSFYESCPSQRPGIRLLLSLPDHYAPAALQWLKTKFLPECAGTSGRISFQVSSRVSCDEAARVRFHWQSIRMISRCLDPAAMEWDEGGRRVPLADLLQIPARLRSRYRRGGRCKKRGQSETLTAGSMKQADELKMPFLSAVRDRAWGFVNAGWELKEYEARRLEQGRRRAALDRAGGVEEAASELAKKLIANERAKLELRWSSDPKSWSRRWIGWWQPVRARLKVG